MLLHKNNVYPLVPIGNAGVKYGWFIETHTVQQLELEHLWWSENSSTAPRYAAWTLQIPLIYLGMGQPY